MSDSDAAEILVKLAVLDERVATLAQKVHELTECQGKLVAQANRWKGAFGLLLAVGGVLGWLTAALGDRLIK